MAKTKPFEISKEIVWQAWRRVRQNNGAPGIDGVSLEEFERNLKDNLYKIWNRMSSGCYFPPAVKAVAIPKSDGGTRILGIPTVADRIAQTVAKMYFEPVVEPLFHSDSYAYRPTKSALDAVSNHDIPQTISHDKSQPLLKIIRFKTEVKSQNWQSMA